MTLFPDSKPTRAAKAETKSRRKRKRESHPIDEKLERPSKRTGATVILTTATLTCDNLSSKGKGRVLPFDQLLQLLCPLTSHTHGSLWYHPFKLEMLLGLGVLSTMDVNNPYATISERGKLTVKEENEMNAVMLSVNRLTIRLRTYLAKVTGTLNRLGEWTAYFTTDHTALLVRYALPKADPGDEINVTKFVRGLWRLSVRRRRRCLNYKIKALMKQNKEVKHNLASLRMRLDIPLFPLVQICGGIQAVCDAALADAAVPAQTPPDA
ncbi:uncharacterized protein AMSG_11271 [Thecamonas trahens ATCC 50062]|uniref:Uncharacterized protein n=1 Tax=Thecamonas trahens ATCC 50062 TaxID=461836 RepID=A0A0L0DU84_THETB|nr:hypothetical protein AMSG_11271 [Thecamonas trahens ATCC 50062]KNC55830.1 hypothetical protein AMSG_11271 [Thecamonas trahens ATCC 50062]|eukprot:XP_013752807.1 hypothetical protein AMSG_11271 [Thecamonas trahens ATCC 50062]